MQRQIVTALSLAALVLLLTGAPAVAASPGQASAAMASADALPPSAWLPPWLEEVLAWLSEMFPRSEYQKVNAASDGSDTNDDSGNPTSSGPGVVLTPMGGADIDPDG
jgi:hypothetical protein